MLELQAHNVCNRKKYKCAWLIYLKDFQIGSQSKNYLYAAHKVHTWKKELHSKEMEVYAKTY